MNVVKLMPAKMMEAYLWRTHVLEEWLCYHRFRECWKCGPPCYTGYFNHSGYGPRLNLKWTKRIGVALLRRSADWEDSPKAQTAVRKLDHWLRRHNLYWDTPTFTEKPPPILPFQPGLNPYTMSRSMSQSRREDMTRKYLYWQR